GPVALIQRAVDLWRDARSTWRCIRTMQETAAEFKRAADARDFRGVRYLMEIEEPFGPFMPSSLMLSRAARDGDLDLMDFYLYCGVQGLNSALHSAAESGQTRIMEILLDRGADPNYIGYLRQSALMAAASKGQLEA